MVELKKQKIVKKITGEAGPESLALSTRLKRLCQAIHKRPLRERYLLNLVFERESGCPGILISLIDWLS